MGCVLPADAATGGGAVRVFRFYNASKGAHFYTSSQAEAEKIAKTMPEWKSEGFKFVAYSKQVAGTKPLYRFYNSKVGSHFYTVDAAEKDNIIKTMKEWAYEGISYYVFA